MLYSSQSISKTHYEYTIVSGIVYFHRFEDYLHCFPESVNQIELGKSTSCAELSSHRSITLKPVKGTQQGFPLTRVTIELTNFKHKTNSSDKNTKFLPEITRYFTFLTQTF